MKKTFLLLSISAMSVASAQSISIDDTLSTGKSTTYYEAVTTAPTLDNITGTGVTWDYSTLQPENSNLAIKDTIIPASASTYSSDYPAAHYQEQFEAGVQVFFSNTATETISHGFAFDLNGTPATLKYNDNQFISAQYPMTMTTDYTDAIEGELNTTYLAQAINVDLIGNATVKVDGTGTLNLSSETFNNVIRIKTIEVLDGTVPAIPPIFAGSDVTVTRTSYSYYLTSTSKFPIFMHGTIDAVFASTIPSTSQVNVWSSVILGTSAGISTDEISSTSIFPNPATELVSIESNNATSIHIFNTVGQVMYSNSNPSTIESVDVSTFETGIYIVEVKNNEIITTEKLIIK